MKNIKDNKAITLIALVVTIIILLILAGVTIGFAVNGTGLFEKAKLATDEYNNSVEKENIELEKATNEIDKYVNNNREIIKVPTIYYVGELNKITGNNGVVTSTFDIKPIYSDYGNLTFDNFVFQISHMYNHWCANPNLSGEHNTLSKEYNATTGILTIKNCYQIGSFNSGIEGKVYLIPDIESVN